MEEWIDVFTAAAAMRVDDRLANELIGAGSQTDGNVLNSFSTKVKHQAGQVSQSVASSVEGVVSKTSDTVDTLLSCFSCLGRNSQEELWAAPFNANAAANSGAPAVAAAATHNPMQLLPAPRPAAHRGPMGAGQPIPRTVHNRNPFLEGGAAAGPGSVPPNHRSVVNPLRPLQRSDAGSSASSSRITHNPMRSTSGGSGGLMRQGYVLPDVSEDMDEDLRDDTDGPQDIEDNV